MKYVNLLAAAYVNGVMRQPHEGSIRLNDAEAKRLVDGGLAKDVTEDFPADDDTPPAKVTQKPSDPKAA